MPKLTKKTILKTICQKNDIKPEYLEITYDRSERCYFFAGKLGACLQDSLAYSSLDSRDLNGWVMLFELQLKKSELLGKDLNAFVESIDWDID